MSRTCSVSGHDNPRVLGSSPTTKNVQHLIVHAFEQFTSSGQFQKVRTIGNSEFWPVSKAAGQEQHVLTSVEVAFSLFHSSSAPSAAQGPGLGDPDPRRRIIKIGHVGVVREGRLARTLSTTVKSLIEGIQTDLGYFDISLELGLGHCEQSFIREIARGLGYSIVSNGLLEMVLGILERFELMEFLMAKLPFRRLAARLAWDRLTFRGRGEGAIVKGTSVSKRSWSKSDQAILPA
ncbi:MAG: hypothetical protein Q9173_005205 [Seirophora scorigena]